MRRHGRDERGHRLRVGARDRVGGHAVATISAARISEKFPALGAVLCVGVRLARLKYRRQRAGRAQRAPQRLDRVSGSASLNRARRHRRAGGALRRRA